MKIIHRILKAKMQKWKNPLYSLSLTTHIEESIHTFYNAPKKDKGNMVRFDLSLYSSGRTLNKQIIRNISNKPEDKNTKKQYSEAQCGSEHILPPTKEQDVTYIPNNGSPNKDVSSTSLNVQEKQDILTIPLSNQNTTIIPSINLNNKGATYAHLNLQHDRIIPFGIEEFSQARYSEYFVDKTDFIIEALKIPIGEVCFISAPRRWGKSTNLNMLKMFFDINQVNSQKFNKSTNQNMEEETGGIRKRRSSIVGPLNNPRRMLFEGTNIFKNQELFNCHFGRYPVIYMNLVTHKDLTSEEVLGTLYDDGNSLRRQYGYIEKNKKIAKRYREAVKRLEEKNLDGINFFFLELCKLLFLYHGTQPVILKDECDQPVSYVIRNCNDKDEYAKIIEIYKSFFVSLLQTNTAREFTVLTGVTRLRNCNGV